ncbi:DNA polymerase III subunit delta' [Aureibaculum sp. 2210JD6-5]|uniref:DNA polymerase III subunit n=1 Tax=Aureibaculum sp. 2210JD6-5 TaxID=3103957 RepID=UPI002AADA1CE|nr:DNA polymerase III subunit delta' [Aureibaculum sp. 2210JD6-5]MDY7396542.1 DNA polymerase III subunit delta' [Aureibaculum sp. 2210JD6-5]
MLFSDIINQETVKKQLFYSVESGRIPHAQLFVAPKGTGALPLAIAYSQYILCNNKDGENTNGNEACNIKVNNLSHPDLHFAFPVATTDKVKRHPVSDLFLEEWRQFLKDNPYGDLLNWYAHLGIENKQGQIGVDEAEAIVKKLVLKSYEGGHKVMIIWMAEKLNTAAANKLLKLVEEPPNKTILLLITENQEQIISTILSRCQVIKLKPLSENHIKDALMAQEDISENEALKIAHQSDGNWNKALHILNNSTNEEQFEQWFITWVRTAFKAKGNAAVIQDLIAWSDAIASNGREVQKSFLNYCLQFFRQAMLKNYTADSLVFLEPYTETFDLDKFAPFIHSGNILEISNELNDAIYHIERNGNAKIILLDLSIKLTRLLHQKENA